MKQSLLKNIVVVFDPQDPFIFKWLFFNFLQRLGINNLKIILSREDKTTLLLRGHPLFLEYVIEMDRENLIEKAFENGDFLKVLPISFSNNLKDLDLSGCCFYISDINKVSIDNFSFIKDNYFLVFDIAYSWFLEELGVLRENIILAPLFYFDYSFNITSATDKIPPLILILSFECNNIVFNFFNFITKKIKEELPLTEVKLIHICNEEECFFKNSGYREEISSYQSFVECFTSSSLVLSLDLTNSDIILNSLLTISSQLTLPLWISENSLLVEAVSDKFFYKKLNGEHLIEKIRVLSNDPSQLLYLGNELKEGLSKQYSSALVDSFISKIAFILKSLNKGQDKEFIAKLIGKLNNNDIEEVEKLVMDFISNNPPIEDLYHILAMVAYKKNDINLAIEYIAKEINLFPYNNEAKEFLTYLKNRAESSK